MFICLVSMPHFADSLQPGVFFLAIVSYCPSYLSAVCVAHFFYHTVFGFVMHTTLSVLTLFMVLIIITEEAILWVDEWHHSGQEGFPDVDRRLTHIMKRTMVRFAVNGIVNSSIFGAQAIFSKGAFLSAFGTFGTLLTVLSYVMVLITLMSTSVYLEQHLQHSHFFRVVHAIWAALGRWVKNFCYIDGVDLTNNLFRSIRREAVRDDDWARLPPSANPLQIFSKVHYSKNGESEDRPVVMYSQHRIYWRRTDYYDMQQNSVRVVPATTDPHDNDLIALLRTRQRIAAFLMLYKESEEVAAAAGVHHFAQPGRTTSETVRIAAALHDLGTSTAASTAAAAHQHARAPLMLAATASIRSQQRSLLHESIRHMKQSILLNKHNVRQEHQHLAPTTITGVANMGNVEVDHHQFCNIISSSGGTSIWTDELSSRLAYAIAANDHPIHPKHTVLHKMSKSMHLRSSITADAHSRFPFRYSGEPTLDVQGNGGRASILHKHMRESDSMVGTDLVTSFHHSLATSSRYQKFHVRSSAHRSSQRRSVGPNPKTRPQSLLEEVKRSTRYANQSRKSYSKKVARHSAGGSRRAALRFRAFPHSGGLQHDDQLHTQGGRTLTSEEQKQAQAIVGQMKCDIVERFKARQARKAIANDTSSANKLLLKHQHSRSPQRNGPFNLVHTLGPRIHTNSKRSRQHLGLPHLDGNEDDNHSAAGALPDEPEDDDEWAAQQHLHHHHHHHRRNQHHQQRQQPGVTLHTKGRASAAASRLSVAGAAPSGGRSSSAKAGRMSLMGNVRASQLNAGRTSSKLVGNAGVGGRGRQSSIVAALRTTRSNVRASQMASRTSVQPQQQLRRKRSTVDNAVTKIQRRWSHVHDENMIQTRSASGSDHHEDVELGKEPRPKKVPSTVQYQMRTSFEQKLREKRHEMQKPSKPFRKTNHSLRKSEITAALVAPMTAMRNNATLNRLLITGKSVVEDLKRTDILSRHHSSRHQRETKDGPRMSSMFVRHSTGKLGDASMVGRKMIKSATNEEGFLRQTLETAYGESYTNNIVQNFMNTAPPKKNARSSIITQSLNILGILPTTRSRAALDIQQVLLHAMAKRTHVVVLSKSNNISPPQFVSMQDDPWLATFERAYRRAREEAAADEPPPTENEDDKGNRNLLSSHLVSAVRASFRQPALVHQDLKDLLGVQQTADLSPAVLLSLPSRFAEIRASVISNASIPALAASTMVFSGQAKLSSSAPLVSAAYSGHTLTQDSNSHGSDFLSKTHNHDLLSVSANLQNPFATSPLPIRDDNVKLVGTFNPKPGLANIYDKYYYNDSIETSESPMSYTVTAVVDDGDELHDQLTALPYTKPRRISLTQAKLLDSGKKLSLRDMVDFAGSTRKSSSTKTVPTAVDFAKTRLRASSLRHHETTTIFERINFYVKRVQSGLPRFVFNCASHRPTSIALQFLFLLFLTAATVNQANLLNPLRTNLRLMTVDDPYQEAADSTLDNYLASVDPEQQTRAVILWGVDFEALKEEAELSYSKFSLEYERKRLLFDAGDDSRTVNKHATTSHKSHSYLTSSHLAHNPGMNFEHNANREKSHGQQDMLEFLNPNFNASGENFQTAFSLLCRYFKRNLTKTDARLYNIKLTKTDLKGFSLGELGSHSSDSSEDAQQAFVSALGDSAMPLYQISCLGTDMRDFYRRAAYSTSLYGGPVLSDDASAGLRQPITLGKMLDLQNVFSETIYADPHVRIDRNRVYQRHALAPAVDYFLMGGYVHTLPLSLPFFMSRYDGLVRYVPVSHDIENSLAVAYNNPRGLDISTTIKNGPGKDFVVVGGVRIAVLAVELNLTWPAYKTTDLQAYEAEEHVEHFIEWIDTTVIGPLKPISREIGNYIIIFEGNIFKQQDHVHEHYMIYFGFFDIGLAFVVITFVSGNVFTSLVTILFTWMTHNVVELIYRLANVVKLTNLAILILHLVTGLAIENLNELNRAYAESHHHHRLLRLAEMLDKVTWPLFLGSMLTICSLFPFLFMKTLLFRSLGVLMCTVYLVMLIFAQFLFPALLAISGPEAHFGNIYHIFVSFTLRCS